MNSPLTEVSGEEEGLCSWSPLLKEQAAVRLPLHAEALVAAGELVKASLRLLQLEELLLKQLIPANSGEAQLILRARCGYPASSLR